MMRGYPFGYTTVGGSVWGEIIMLIFGLLVLVGIVLLIIWAIRALGAHPQAGTQQPGMPQQPPTPVGHEEAVAIAKRRLASGEITPEQYAEIMKTLGS